MCGFSNTACRILDAYGAFTGSLSSNFRKYTRGGRQLIRLAGCSCFLFILGVQCHVQEFSMEAEMCWRMQTSERG